MSDTKVRLDGPGQLAACVPSLLGFIPDHSAVLVTVVGSRVGMTARVDLDATDERDMPLAIELARAIRRAEPEATEVHVIGWETAVGRVLNLHECLAELGVPVGECLTVQGDTYVVESDDAPEWRKLPVDVVRPAAIATTGAVLRGSRAEVEALVAYTGGKPTVAQRELAVQLADPLTRDALIGALAGLDAAGLAAAQDTYAAMARLYPTDDVRDGALCLTALCAWLTGDGALARVALEACAPGYRLAGLLLAALNAATPPAVVRELIEGLVAA